MGEAIVITSGKGGVGKTTTTANIGISLALHGKKVCMVDTDIGLRNLDVVIGLENRIIYDLVDVINQNCRLQQALIRDKRFEALYLLPAAQTKDKTAVDSTQMKELIAKLKEDFDYVLIDCPAGIEQGFKNAISGADKAIVVTSPEIAAVRDADRVIGLIEAEDNINSLQLAINKIRINLLKSKEIMDIDEIVSILAIDLLGIIPDDENVIKGANIGEPVAIDPNTISGLAYRNIGRRILGENVPLIKMETKQGFIKKMFKKK